MIAFFKDERDAHYRAMRWSSDDPTKHTTALIYEYEVQAPGGFGRSYGYVTIATDVDELYNPQDELVPKDAKKIWRYRGGVPEDVRPHAIEAR